MVGPRETQCTSAFLAQHIPQSGSRTQLTRYFSVYILLCHLVRCFSPLQGPGTLAPEPFSILDLFTDSHWLRVPLSQELLVCFLKSLSICGSIAGSSNWPPKFFRNYPQLLRGELNPQLQSYCYQSNQPTPSGGKKEAKDQESVMTCYPGTANILDSVLRRLLCWTLFLALYPHLVTPFFMVASWRACSLSFSMSLSVWCLFSTQSLPAWLRMGVFRPGSGCKTSAGICLSSQELLQPDQDTFPFFLGSMAFVLTLRSVTSSPALSGTSSDWSFPQPPSQTYPAIKFEPLVATTPPKFPITCAPELFSFCGGGSVATRQSARCFSILLALLPWLTLPFFWPSSSFKSSSSFSVPLLNSSQNLHPVLSTNLPSCATLSDCSDSYLLHLS